MMASDTSERIIAQAESFGASLAGVASVNALKKSPSNQLDDRVRWPANMESVLVLALAHPRSDPERDWWDRHPGGTPGNRQLIAVADKLAQWLKTELAIKARPLPYRIAEGGIFLKDAAALAGLGVIGKNNLLITPQFGAQVRLRALFLDVVLDPTVSIDFDPCAGCDMPCRRACPQDAFALGGYFRSPCSIQMAIDEANAAKVDHGKYDPVPRVVVKYCRACELSCPVGR